jgi:nucleoside-diphosphate-sugar epimerase
LKQENNGIDKSEQLEIVTLHPTFVVGPSIIAERNSSVEGILKIMNRSIPGVPNLTMPSVDVRDVAEAHYQAFIREGLQGQRFLIS